MEKRKGLALRMAQALGNMLDEADGVIALHLLAGVAAHELNITAEDHLRAAQQAYDDSVIHFRDRYGARETDVRLAIVEQPTLSPPPSSEVGIIP